jgi:hypothetical protein
MYTSIYNDKITHFFHFFSSYKMKMQSAKCNVNAIIVFFTLCENESYSQETTNTLKSANEFK